MMDVQFESDDMALLIDAEGQIAARLSRGQMATETFVALAMRMAVLADRSPRMVVCYREGLREDVAADIDCDLILIEDDRFDQPPLQIRRVTTAGDPGAVDTLLERAAANGAVQR